MQRKTFVRTVLAVAAAAVLPLAAQAQALKLTLGHGAAGDHGNLVFEQHIVELHEGERVHIGSAPESG